jgi:hypothetical protein
MVSGNCALPPRWPPQCSCVVIESSFDPGERLQAPGSLWFSINLNNKQFIPRVYMFINHKMTHRYIWLRFTRHALQLHHVTMLNYLHGYKRLCCQNLAYPQTEIKWSFFVEQINSWFAGTHKSHENWYTTNKNEFTVC